jgi:hypothetical protein
MQRLWFFAGMLLAVSAAGCASGGTSSSGSNERSVTTDVAVNPGAPSKVDQFSYIKPAPNCGEVPGTKAFVTRSPANGVVMIQRKMDFSPYPEGNSSAACNSRRVPVWVVLYRPNPGFAGNDTFNYDKSFANGVTVHATVNVTVR